MGIQGNGPAWIPGQVKWQIFLNNQKDLEDLPKVTPLGGGGSCRIVLQGYLRQQQGDRWPKLAKESSSILGLPASSSYYDNCGAPPTSPHPRPDPDSDPDSDPDQDREPQGSAQGGEDRLEPRPRDTPPPGPSPLVSPRRPAPRAAIRREGPAVGGD